MTMKITDFMESNGSKFYSTTEHLESFNEELPEVDPLSLEEGELYYAEQSILEVLNRAENSLGENSADT